MLLIILKVLLSLSILVGVFIIQVVLNNLDKVPNWIIVSLIINVLIPVICLLLIS